MSFYRDAEDFNDFELQGWIYSRGGSTGRGGCNPPPPPPWLAQIRQNAPVSIYKFKKNWEGPPATPPFLQTWIRAFGRP